MSCRSKAASRRSVSANERSAEYRLKELGSSARQVSRRETTAACSRSAASSSRPPIPRTNMPEGQALVAASVGAPPIIVAVVEIVPTQPQRSNLEKKDTDVYLTVLA